MATKNDLFLHADGDSFFVACELVSRPELRGKPVVVGEDRGIAVAMSAEAKKLGVTRGMPVFEIKKKFPKVIILPHSFGLYREISDKVYEILLSYMSEVERYSIDECFAVATPADIKYAKGAEKFVREIKNEIQDKLGVTYSFGLARTKTLAKTASKLNKPNGLVVLLNEKDEVSALKKTKVEDVWGIGRKTVPRLLNRAIMTAYDFVKMDSKQIEKHFSEPLLDLQKELMGEVRSSVESNVDPRDQKSLQSTATFKPSSSDKEYIWAELSDNVEEACERARELHLLTKSVSFFVKNTDFIHREGSAKLSFYSADAGVILNAIEPIFKKVLKKGEMIRSTGITLHALTKIETIPDDLFGNQKKANEKLVVEEVADRMRAKYGRNAIKHASALKTAKKNRGNSFFG
ncbi:MAG: DNA polymerase IV [Candidatus Pacebacteria bacterium]|nr:DNA polymerase IV [Candidatus Paceibacterota bacterium]